MEKEFKAFGLKFKPLKTLKGKESKFENISKRINEIGLTPKNWNYKEFYEIASKFNCLKIDLFEIEIKEVKYVIIPATNYLFQYKD